MPFAVIDFDQQKVRIGLLGEVDESQRGESLAKHRHVIVGSIAHFGAEHLFQCFARGLRGREDRGQHALLLFGLGCHSVTESSRGRVFTQSRSAPLLARPYPRGWRGVRPRLPAL